MPAMAKILILTPQLPYPPVQGTSLRNFHILQGLARHHHITLLSFMEAGQREGAEHTGPLQDLCERIWTVPVPPRSWRKRLVQLFTSGRPDLAGRLRSSQFTAKLASLLQQEEFDIIQIEGLELAYLLSTVVRHGRRVKVLFDNHNMETEIQRRAFRADLATVSRWPAALYSWLQIGRIRRFERWACQQADWTTVVSEVDRLNLLAILPEPAPPVSVVPNCIDVPQYQAAVEQATSGLKREAEQEKTRYTFDILFTGKMDYRPNVDAVLWFAREIWPGIRSVRPNTTWAIVGQRVHRRLQPLRQVEGIVVTGHVAQIEPYMAGASVYVAPFRIGGGTRLKLIEAMAAGKAIVSTPMGAEGYGVSHDRELLLASTANEMVASILHLLGHPGESRRLGEAAAAFARQYDWRRVVAAFEVVYGQMLAE